MPTWAAAHHISDTKAKFSKNLWVLSFLPHPLPTSICLCHSLTVPFTPAIWSLPLSLDASGALL